MTDRIALLHLVNEFAYSSTNYRIFNLLNVLDRDRYDLHIGCITPKGGPMAENYASLGIQVTNFALPAQHPGWNLRLLSRIHRYVERHDIQILHTHALRADIFGGLSVRFRTKRPVLISTKGNAWYNSSQRGWILRNLLYWPAMYLPDLVVTVSRQLRSDLLERIRIDPKRIVAIHTGIQFDQFGQNDERGVIRHELGIPTDSEVVIYTGRLVTGKGLNDLIHAFQDVFLAKPHVYLLLVGAGPLLKPLKKLALDLNVLERVIFLGFRRDVPDLLNASDVFVQPSLTEGLSQSIIEAMASELCVIATNVGGTPELINSGVTGLLLPPGNRRALADAIISVIDNPILRQSLGKNANEFVRHSFTIQNMVKNYDDIYQTFSEKLHLI